MLNNISSEWQSWISENLQRGCTPDSLQEIMIKNNFDATDALMCIQQIAQKSANPTSAQTAPSQNSSYVYEPSRIALGNQLSLSDKTVQVALRLSQPDIVLFNNLLSPDECTQLIALSKHKLKPSTIVDPDTGKLKIITARSSEGCHFQRDESAFIQKLDQRIAELMNWPAHHGEGLQVLHYSISGEYRPHYDYFPVEHPGNSNYLRHGGQRVATLIMYLNDVEAGGETIFPEIGLSIAPRQGAAVYFSYTNSLGQLNPKSLHGGAPVIQGEKWIATKWMRQFSY